MTDSINRQLFEEIIKRLDIMIGRNAELLGRVQDEKSEDHLTALLNLEQTGIVQDYFDTFNLLQSRVNISKDLVLEVFLRGLKPDIEIYVRLFNPRFLKEAYSLARLKELTIPVLGVKEDVVDELRAGAELEYAKEGPENAGAFEVFDEMPVKDMIGVSDANMSIKVRPEPESCFQGKEFQDDVSLWSKEDKYSSWRKQDGASWSHISGGGRQHACNFGSTDMDGFSKHKPDGDLRTPTNLPSRIIREPESHPKAGTPIVKIWLFMYPSTEKGNLRLGRDMEAIYCQGCRCLIFSSMNLEDKVL